MPFITPQTYFDFLSQRADFVQLRSVPLVKFIDLNRIPFILRNRIHLGCILQGKLHLAVVVLCIARQNRWP